MRARFLFRVPRTKPVVTIVQSIGRALCGVVFAACSSTVVVLVPDPDGKVGEVSVATEGGERVLNQAGESTEVSSDPSVAPSEPRILSETEINRMFAAAIDNEPRPPQRFIFYFGFDSAQLLPDAERQIPEIHREVESRTICELSIIGHSDRVGVADYNRALSLKRASAVAELLRKQKIPDECMDIRYYGESDPLVPTEDDVPEPRNRRVEVEVR